MIPLKHLERFYPLAKGKFFYVLRDSMDGMHDDNFYFNNPVPYMPNQRTKLARRRVRSPKPSRRLP